MRLHPRGTAAARAFGYVLVVVIVTGFVNSAGAETAPLRGTASWYGAGFQGQKMASGERFDPSAMIAAHRKLPFGTRVIVTNLDNGRTVEVEIKDRGPHVKGRIIDLSQAAARKLGFINAGTARVRIDVVGERKQTE